MNEKTPPHFHFHAQWIQAKAGCNAGRAVSAYMHRGSSPAEAVSDYMNRSREEDMVVAREGEVAHSFLFANGLEIDAKDLWHAVDKVSRSKSGDYKSHAGRLPRLGIFIDASFPYDAPKQAAIVAAEHFARAVVAKYGCAVEGAIHYKDGQYDHAHFAIVDRHVGPQGVGTTKIREFNGVAAKAEGAGIRDGDKVLAPAKEFMRSEWAAEMRKISGNEEIDHRSYARQGNGLTPVTHVRRGEIKFEERQRTSNWQRRRARELATRHPAVWPQLLAARVAAKKMARSPVEAIAAATTILSQHMPAEMANVLARISTRIGKGSALTTALYSKAIADHLHQASNPPPELNSIALIQPPRRKKAKQSQLAATSAAAAMLCHHVDPQAAAILAMATRRVSPHSTAISSLIAKALANQLNHKIDGGDQIGAAEIRPPVLPPSAQGHTYYDREVPDYVRVAATKTMSFRSSTPFSSFNSGVVRTLSAALSTSIGQPVSHTVRSALPAGPTISEELKKANYQTYAAEEEARNKLIAQRLARQAELSWLAAKHEEEQQQMALSQRAERQSHELWRKMSSLPLSPEISSTEIQAISPLDTSPGGIDGDQAIPPAATSDVPYPTARNAQANAALRYMALLKQNHQAETAYFEDMAKIAGMSVPDFEAAVEQTRLQLFVQEKMPTVGLARKIVEAARQKGLDEFVAAHARISTQLKRKHAEAVARSRMQNSHKKNSQGR